MKDILITPSYFPSIAHYIAMANAKSTFLEVCENYQKQSFRNSTYINTNQGKAKLTVPVVYSQKNGHVLTKNIKIANGENWQKQHLKTLETAYNSSPFFEFYIDDLLPVFTEKFNDLLTLNLKTIALINDLLALEAPISKTTAYEMNPKAIDLRFLANRRKAKTYAFDTYTQVFGIDFQSNLSILDLLFMEGPSALLYLERQKLKLIDSN
jgi:hypothetical protein